MDKVVEADASGVGCWAGDGKLVLLLLGVLPADSKGKGDRIGGFIDAGDMDGAFLPSGTFLTPPCSVDADRPFIAVVGSGIRSSDGMVPFPSGRLYPAAVQRAAKTTCLSSQVSINYLAWDTLRPTAFPCRQTFVAISRILPFLP